MTPWMLIAMVIITSVDPDIKQSTSIEIYNRDQALIHEVRQVDFDKGVNTVDFHRISDGIFGRSIQINPLENQSRLATRSITFRYNMISHDKLIEYFTGRWFAFSTGDMEYAGRLLYTDSEHLFLQPDTTDPQIEVVDRGEVSDMIYPEIPDKFSTESTLRWVVEADRGLKKQNVELSYLTSDISWMCDYRAEISGDETLLLSAVFSIDNQLPLDFPDAEVALVAGSTHRSADPKGGDDLEYSAGAGNDKSAASQRFFEYYRFPVEYKLNLESHQTIQVPFFSPIPVKVEKRFIFPHLLQGGTVQVKLKLHNNEDSGLGRPLPEGNIGIYKRTDGGNLSFLGEDFLLDTPTGGEAEINVGDAFDINARRTRIAQGRPQRDRHEETWRVEIISNRSEPTTVHIEQKVFGYYQVALAEVDGKEIEYYSESANVLMFPVVVNPGKRAVLDYSLVHGF